MNFKNIIFPSPKEIFTLELEDGQVIAEYSEDFELVGVSDWNGNDLSSTKWESIALEKLEEMKEETV